jgi:hypothetical protein
MAIYNADKKA